MQCLTGPRGEKCALRATVTIRRRERLPAARQLLRQTSRRVLGEIDNELLLLLLSAAAGWLRARSPDR
jgi:hypothetical protein